MERRTRRATASRPDRPRGEPPEGGRAPAPLSRFIGRQRELSELAALVRSSRLVCLWGPIGIGKTRLARALVGAAASELDAWTFAALVELEGVSDPIDVCDRSLAALRLGRAAPRLLVIDGADACLDVLAAELPRWAARAPRTTFLVTSCERGRLPGERAFELGPLTTPLEGEDPAESPAVQLFLDRAQAAASRASLGDIALPAIAAIVSALEGAPALIELAASCVPAMGVEGVRGLCVGASAGGGVGLELLRVARPPRGRRRGAIVERLSSSIEGLPASLRDALQVLSLFEGAFTAADAAAALELRDRDALDRVQALRDRSLLGGPASLEGEARLSVGPVVRGISLRSMEPARRAAAEERLAGRVLAVAEKAAAAFALSGARHALDELGARRADLLAIAERSLAAEPERSARAIAALDPLLLTMGPRLVPRPLLDRAIEMAVLHAIDAETTALLFAARGRARSLAEGARAGMPDLEAALSTLRRAGGGAAGGRAAAALLLDLGVLHHRLRDLDAARESYVAARRECAPEDARTEARAVGNLAAVAHDQCRLEEAAPEYERAIAIASAAGDARLEGIFAANLGIVDQERGAMRSALRRYERAVVLLEEARDRRLYAITLGNLGMLHHEEGRLDAARRCHERAIAELSSVGDVASLSLSRGRLAAVLASEDRLEEARALLERGARALPRGGDAMGEACLRLAHAFVDVALARRAVLERRDAELAARLDAARGRMDEVRAMRGLDGEPLTRRSDDVRALLRVLERNLDASSGGLLSPPDEALLVAPEARWFRPPGGIWSDLRQRHAARRILERLCAEQHDAPGRGLRVEALRDAGWPGERMLLAAAKNRIYVVLNQLRELGLRKWLLHVGGGWALDPMLVVRRVALEPVLEPPRPGGDDVEAAGSTPRN